MTALTSHDPARLVLRPTTPADRPLLERLWLLFRHDMSDVTGALPDATGEFRREPLDAAFTEPGWQGFVAHLEGGAGPAAAGFALVRGTDKDTRVLSSFFVVRGARRGGVGRRLAAHVLAAFPGRWEIAFQDANRPAVRFWRQVATEAAGEDWTEERRPVPGRPDVPPDTWITLVTRGR